MLVPLDDSPWHQIPTTFDHVGTSDVRFFDRLWFAASAPDGSGTLQFTIGVYQNMNVIDGGIVVIRNGRQHNVRVSRQLRPTYDTCCGPLRIIIGSGGISLNQLAGAILEKTPELPLPFNPRCDD